MSSPEEQIRRSVQERYELVREVGQGARAVVYLARDRKHDRPVAIKVLRPEFTASLGADRFLKEIGIAARMTHPHILPLFDSGQAGEALYYVTPFVKGQSLRDRIREEGRLPIPHAVDLARQIGEALDYAHRNGVVHRDIKPENVLLEDGQAVIADFGIARAVSAAGGKSLTATGMAVGTPAYMSPEQIEGVDAVDGRADLYALGCVLFEMLVGRPPFASGTAQSVIAQHLTRQPPSPTAERPEIPVWLDRVVLRLLAKDPAQRFQTAENIAAELAVHSRSDLDAVTDPWMRWLYRIHRRRRLLLAGALVLFLVVGGLAVSRILRPSGAARESGDRSPLTTVAIYPLHDLSEQDRADLANGLTAQLTDHLGKLPPLTVVPSLTMREHVRTGTPLDSIVLRHRVGTVISGTLLATDRDVQVLLELSDAVAGVRFASAGPITRPRGELILLLEDLADELTRLLRRRLGGEITRRELKAGTECSECLELLFQANERSGDVRSFMVSGETETARRALAEADSILRIAEDLDPDWMEPVLGRGWVDADRARRFTPQAGDYDTASARSGVAHAERVLQVDPRNGDALALRGVLRFYLAEEAQDSLEQARLWAAARRDLEGAVRIDPGAARAWNALSNIRRREGRFREAKDAAENALLADLWLLNDEDTVYHLCSVAMELEEAEDMFHWCVEEGRRRFPHRLGFVSAEIVLLASWEGWAPDADWAWALADTALEIGFADRRTSYRPLFRMDVAAVLARGGDADSARAVVQQARAMAEGEDPRLDYREAHARLQLGEEEEAVRLLSRYLAARPDRRAYVAKDWWFRSLREDPAFQALVGEAGG